MGRVHRTCWIAFAGALALQLTACSAPAPAPRQPSADADGVAGIVFCWSDSLGSYVAADKQCKPGYTSISQSKFRERREAKAVATLSSAHPDLVSGDVTSFSDRFDMVGSGTAFFITQDGYLITNKHVVEGCDVMTLIGSDALYIAVVIDTDDRDLALLKADLHVDSYAFFTRRQLRVGEDVYAIGYPLLGDLGGLTVTDGIVSSLAGPPDSPQFIQISTPIQPGNSGGPLVDQYGTIAGVVTAKDSGLVGDTILEGVGFAIHPHFITRFMVSNGVEPVLLTYTELATPNIVEYVREYTYPVACWVRKKTQP